MSEFPSHPRAEASSSASSTFSSSAVLIHPTETGTGRSGSQAEGSEGEADSFLSPLVDNYGATLAGSGNPRVAGSGEGANFGVGTRGADVGAHTHSRKSSHAHAHAHGHSRSRSALGPFPPAPHPSAPALRLTFPYPLPILALLDALYVAHHATQAPRGAGAGASASAVPPALAALTAARVLALGGMAGCSRRWRSRGGWVAGASGLSVGVAVWMFCVRRLERGLPSPGAGGGGDGQAGEGGEGGVGEAELGVFMYTTIFMAAFEYLAFLLLLRLSPPPHRPQPLSLLHSSRATQQAVPFAYTTSNAELGPRTPRSVRLRRYSTRTSVVSPFTGASAAPSRARTPAVARGREAEQIRGGQRSAARSPDTVTFGSFGEHAGPSRLYGRFGAQGGDHSPVQRQFGERVSVQNGVGGPGRVPGEQGHPWEEDGSDYCHDDDEDHAGEGDSGTDDYDHDDEYHDGDDQDNDDDDEDDGYSSSSSISASSIIDLPPPLSPHRVVVPIPLAIPLPTSLSMRSNLARAIDSSPLLGPIVRRTRSGVFGRSAGSTRGWEAQPGTPGALEEEGGGSGARARAGAGAGAGAGGLGGRNNAAAEAADEYGDGNQVEGHGYGTFGLARSGRGRGGGE